ncbi:MAG: class I SAM-dependent methyltransferase [Candidatus Hydrogenedentota bacterium]
MSHTDPGTSYDYDRAAPDYDRHRAGAGPYFEALITHTNILRAQQVLEIGAGTGNETIPFLEAHPCTLTTLEYSAGMLAQGRAKELPVRWVRGDGMHLPFSEGAFDFIYASYVLHHIPDVVQLCAECRRVLTHGSVAFITVPETFIQSHPLNAYFPSLAVVDGKRFQPIGEVIEALNAAGFDHAGSDHCVGPPRPVDEEYAQWIADKFISTYDLIPDEELRTGLARLRQDIAAAKAPSIAREASVVWGYA